MELHNDFVKGYTHGGERCLGEKKGNVVIAVVNDRLFHFEEFLIIVFFLENV